ncbi:VirE-like protein [Arcicella aurantiaca]|uniref:VirE-like protein n=1 Tax=Arcicella aurantiaca TaxID=591202 RepID=A0A316DIA9_9BACT|nr:CRISPR-associated primase-polymerase type B [Arcicella aurantiaca]PWK16959.1 VirE-like protein [Arcicella aurantiaca]
MSYQLTFKPIYTFNTTPQLSLGFAITSASETLQRVTIEDVVALISGQKPSSLAQEVARLQKLRNIDKTAYRTLKTRLPYIVGGVFQQDCRRIENINAVNFIILDIDHLTDFDGSIPEAIKADDTVLMAFISPSGEGIKVIFRLSEPLVSAQGFQIAYRDFAEKFGVKVGLTGFIDLKTSDVSRACFLSHDTNVYYNPSAVGITLNIMSEIFEATGASHYTEENQIAVLEDKNVNIAKGVINETAYKAILREINPNTPVRIEKDIFVPKEITELFTEIEKLCTQVGLELLEQKPIQYGVKIIAKQGYRKAEVNVFYGKKGYSVVVSPKTGIDDKLNQLLHQTIFDFLFPKPIPEEVSLVGFISPN